MKFTFDGQLIQQSTQVANKRDAATIESAYRTQLALGKIGIETKREAPAFDKTIEDFLSWSKIEHGESSQRRYYFTCQPLKSYFGKTKVNKIETHDIEKYIAWRKSQPSKKTGGFISRETVNRELVILKKIFRRLIDDRVIRDNPARNIKLLAANDLSFHVLTEKEEKAYLMACPQPLRDIAALMLETGMRPDEAYRIRRNDVFFENDYLQIVKGKTKSSARRIHLSDKAKEILAARIERFDGQFLFPQNEVDGENSTKTIDYFHRKTVKRLGFDFRLYDCRHTFATRVLETGIDLLTLASLLGHANLKMVMRYAHPSEERKAEAIRLMQKRGSVKKAKAV